MRSLLYAAILLWASCVVQASEEEVTDRIDFVVGLEYTQTCIDNGFFVPKTKEGSDFVDYIWAATESKLYYNRLSKEGKQQVANRLWEMETMFSLDTGCKVLYEASEVFKENLSFISGSNKT